MNADGERDDGRSGCPDPAELAAFSLGKLDEDALQRVAGHLQECQRCENTLLELDDSNDTMISRLRGVGSVPVYRGKPAYQEFERRISSIRFCGAATPPVVEELPEQLGPYRIIELLSEGGMGVVYKAEHVHLKREIALKILPRDRSHDRRYVNRFCAEMRAIGRLDHPHVVRALDAGVEDRFHFLAMEYIAGTDVSKIVSGKRQLPVADACEIVRQAALGLAYIHQNGFVHRDIKPSNLMLTGAGQVKILDLGLALLRHRESGASRLTSADQLLGTADYMAPEQGFGEGSLDRRADLYSLGCVLYRLLTGRVPFEGADYSTTLKKLAAHANDPPTPLRRYRSGLGAEVEHLVERLLAKDPRERFDSAGELADQLADHAQGAALADVVGRNTTYVQSADQLSVAAPRQRTTDVDRQPRVDTRSRLRARLLMVSLLAGLLATAGAIAGFFLVTPRSTDGDRSVSSGPGAVNADLPVERVSGAAPPRQPHFELLASDEVRRNYQYALLNTEPRLLHWPKSPLSTLRYSAEMRQISASCDGLGLLSLGSVPPVEGYTLRVDFFQNQWVSGVGVFFGLQPFQDVTGSAWRFHRLELRPNRGRDRAEFPFAIKRSLVTIRGRPGDIHIEEVSLCTVPVAQMPRTPQLLEISVRGTRLIRVRWAGGNLRDLCSVETNAGFTREDYFGQFGLYLDASDGVFRNASIILF